MDKKDCTNCRNSTLSNFDYPCRQCCYGMGTYNYWQPEQEAESSSIELAVMESLPPQKSLRDLVEELNKTMIDTLAAVNQMNSELTQLREEMNRLDAIFSDSLR